MPSSTQDPVELTFEQLVHETDGAYLVRIEGRETWLPKSQLIEFDEGDRRLVLPEWLAFEKELI